MAISTPRLNPLRDLHLEPIKVVIFNRPKRPNLEVSFPLICFQRLSDPNYSYPAMPLARQLAHQRLGQQGPLVLLSTPLQASNAYGRKGPTCLTLISICYQIYGLYHSLFLFRKRDRRITEIFRFRLVFYKTKSLRGQALALLAKFKIQNAMVKDFNLWIVILHLDFWFLSLAFAKQMRWLPSVFS